MSCVLHAILCVTFIVVKKYLIMRGSDLTDFIRGQIFALRRYCDWTYRRIAEAVGVSVAAVTKYCQRNVFPERGPSRRSNCRGVCVTGERVNRAIERAAVREPFKGSRKIAAEVAEVGRPISYSTVNRRLNSAGLRSFSPAVKPALTDAHMAARLLWAQQHQATDWSTVIFSDESKFQVGHTRPQYVRRRRNQRLLPAFVVTLKNVSVGSCMVWGSFCRDGFSELVLVEGRMNSIHYIDLLDTVLLPFLYRVNNVSNIEYFQQDNCPVHVSAATTQWLENQEINCLPWPAISPDMNPIENVWGNMKHELLLLTVQPSNSAQLFEACRGLWNTLLSNEQFRHSLIDSMPARLAALISAAGGFTRF